MHRAQCLKQILHDNIENLYNLFKDLGQKILFQITLQQNLQIFNKEKHFVGFFGACYLEKLLLVLFKKKLLHKILS